MVALIQGILSPAIAAEETFGGVSETCLFPEEVIAVERAVEKRRREFTAGRTCARRALAKLGHPAVPILQGAQGQPLWPRGIVGSITHSAGYVAAAAARDAAIAAIGIDAEINENLPEGVIDLIASMEEQRALSRLPQDGVHWERLLFSAKEGVFKACFPLWERWLDFLEARVWIDPDSRTFSARLLVLGPTVDGQVVSFLQGRYAAIYNMVLTSVVIERSINNVVTETESVTN